MYHRICPGRYLADTTIWLSIARILATFDVNPVKVDGKVVMPEMKGTAGIVRYASSLLSNESQ